MARFLHPTLLVAAVLLVLGACGEPTVFRARRGEQWLSFEQVQTTRTVASPLTLSACGENDPQPDAIDDETRLCVHLQLDAARLAEAPLGQPLAIAGTAEVPPASEGAPTFAPAEGHVPQVLGAWATALCFRGARETAVSQQVRGQLVLTRREETRLAGRLELTLEGPVAGVDCELDEGVETSFAFDVQTADALLR